MFPFNRRNRACDNYHRDRLSRQDHFKPIVFFLLFYSYYVPEFSNLLAVLYGIRRESECFADEMIRHRKGNKKVAVPLIRKRARTGQTFRATLTSAAIEDGINLTTWSIWRGGLIINSTHKNFALDETCFNYIEARNVSFASITSW